MKVYSTKAKLLKKVESFISMPQKFNSPSDSALKTKTLLKDISRIFVPKVKSVKVSPKNFKDPNLKFQEKPLKLNFSTKKNSKEIKGPEVRSESTMASLQCYVSSDLSKSPIRQNSKVSSSKKLTNHNRITKIKRIYRLKSSKILSNKKNPDSFQCDYNDYFAGISLPNGKEYQRYNKCSIEYKLAGSTNSINCLEVFNDKIYSGGSDYALRAWNLPYESFEPYSGMKYAKKLNFSTSNVIGTHKKPITTVCASGNTIISGSCDGILKIWSQSGELLRNLKDYSGLKSSKALTPEKLISGGSHIGFWDLESFKEFREACPSKSIECIGFHTNNTFITGSEDSKIKLWDIRAPRNISNFSGHNDDVTGVTMSSAFTVLSCSEDCTLREWDLRKNDCVSIRKSKKSLRGVLVNDNYIVTAGNSILIWDSNSFDEIVYHSGSVKSICYSNNKKLLFTAGYDAIIVAWSFNSKFA